MINFIEGVTNSVVSPSNVFHGQDKKIFSVTSLVGEIICFVLNSSRSLAKFLLATLDGAEPSAIEKYSLLNKVIS